MTVNKIILVYALATWLWFGSTTSSVQSPSLIRSVVSNSDNELKHLVGPGNLCADVSGGYYHDGDPIVLWECKSNEDVNQMWTFGTDGTIRSNGKCLTTYGYGPGSYVMIYSCNTVSDGSNRWQVWENGTITNPKSGLVLTATPATSDTTLTVDTNIYSTTQAWSLSVKSEPSVIVIYGPFDFSLQTYGEEVRLRRSHGGDSSYEQWLQFSDGSLRPLVFLDKCLSCDDGGQGTIVKIVPCNLAGSPGQRWYYNSEEASILNLYSGMVLDVKDGNLQIGEIIIWPPTEGYNQRWFIRRL